MDNITTIFITIIGILGSTAAWDYYQKRLVLKKEEEADEKKDKNLYRDDLKLRVAKLEDLLEIADEDRSLLQERVTSLSAEVASLTTKVEFLTREVDRLEKENHLLRVQ